MRSLLAFFSGTSRAHAWASALLIRLMVGWVFILAGLRKFMEPDTMGAGRFAEMGFPAPGFVGAWVGFWELAGGLLVLLGLLTRFGAIPLMVTMVVALITTKLPVFQADGWIAGLHAARLDVSLLLGATFLLMAGSGPFSIDGRIRERLGAAASASSP